MRFARRTSTAPEMARLYRRQPPVLAALFLPWVLIGSLLLADFRGFSGLPDLAEVGAVVARTLALAGIIAVASVSIGLAFAWLCRDLKGRLAELLAILLLPTLAGPLFWGFFGKIVILRFDAVTQFIEDRSVAPTALLVVVLLLLQTATLASYILFVRARSMPEQLRAYAFLAGLSPNEIARDVFWPHCRSLAYALTFLIFILTATEFATTDLAIHPSVGTDTALVSHWLAETYRTLLPSDPDVAAAQIAVFGAGAAVLAIFFGLLSAVTFVTVADRVAAMPSATLKATARQARATTGSARAASAIAITCVIAAFGMSYALFPPRVTAETLSLLVAAGWALAVAVVCLLVSGLIAVMIRLWSPAAYAGSRTGSIALLYTVILHPLALPPLVLSVAAFWWFGLLGPLGRGAIASAWACGHIFRSMPLLVAFCFWTYSRVRNAEVEYQSLARVGLHDLLKTSFLDRFREDHLLLLLFAWMLAWNDAVVNRAADPDIPTLYMYLAPHLSMRPDFRAAQWSLLISVLVGATILFVWRRITRRVAFMEPA